MGLRDKYRKRRELRRLRKLDLDNLETIPRLKERVPARVVEVYDGDTVTMVYMWGKQAVCTRVRVWGIDAPEMRPPLKLDRDRRELEIRAATLVRDYVEGMLSRHPIEIEVIGFDKYGGRVLGHIYFGGPSLGPWLIEQGFAKSYRGKKKEEWTAKELRLIVETLRPSVGEELD